MLGGYIVEHLLRVGQRHLRCRDRTGAHRELIRPYSGSFAFGFMPRVGGASGLRQPVHVVVLAIGALAAAAGRAAINKFYALPGAETLSYREMIGRTFDGLGCRGVPSRCLRCCGAAAFFWRSRWIPARFSRWASASEGHDLRFLAGNARIRQESEAFESEVRLRPPQSMNTTVLRPLRITRSSR